MGTFKYFEIPVENDQIVRGSLHIAKANSPWIIFCHGFTNQRMGPAYLFVKMARALADNGISSLRFDFRGSGESDGLFANMNVQTMKNDLLCVIKNLNENYNPSSVCLLGHSFGGIIAALCSAMVHGVILLSPVANPQKLLYAHKKIIDGGPNDQGYFEYGPHEMNLSFADHLHVDPVNSLCNNLKGPLLVIQGDADSSIPVQESAVYITEAAQIGIDTEYHVFKGADHNYTRVCDVKSLCSTVINWAKEHICE